MVGGIAHLLPMVYMTGGHFICRNNIVREPDKTAAFANSYHLTNRVTGITIVVQRDAVCYKVECIVLERERVGISGSKFNIPNLAFFRELASRF